MLIVGSDDGAYRLTGVSGAGEPTVRKVLDAGRARRVRAFDALDGVFAATTTGLYHSPDGEAWTDLGVPEDAVYAVGASPDGNRLYAGTRPAHIYAARLDETTRADDAARTDDGSRSDAALDPDALTWRDRDGFQALPSREEWRLPRHENLAQVRDVHVHPEAPDRVVAAVEVGGVHVSEDGGETWTERRGGADDAAPGGEDSGGVDDWDDGGSDDGVVDDDVHELHLASVDEWVAATGFGLYRTTDAGRTWDRLDEGVDQRYFRAAIAVDGTVFAAGALANSSTWNDPDADPDLFAYREGSLERVTLPTGDETVTGMTVVDGSVVAVTHRGTVLRQRPDGWEAVASVPVPGEVTGRYTPLARVEA